MSDINLAEVLERAELLHDRETVEAAIDQMARHMSLKLAGERPIYVTVLTGGLIIAGMLAPRVTVDLDFDYAHVTRYHGEQTGGALEWKAVPRHDFAGRIVVLVDDILDHGNTLDALRRYAYEKGATKVYIAVLVRKIHNRCLPGVDADFVGLTVPDRYVFGCGMDVEEHGRNLFGIYAL
jgi:hypoxanthine phosphoribosyltransferase